MNSRPRPRFPFRLLLVLAVAASLGLAACGDDSSDEIAQLERQIDELQAQLDAAQEDASVQADAVPSEGDSSSDPQTDGGSESLGVADCDEVTPEDSPGGIGFGNISVREVSCDEVLGMLLSNEELEAQGWTCEQTDSFEGGRSYRCTKGEAAFRYSTAD